MPPKKISLFFLSLLVLSASGIADTVVLKDGSQIKGDIIDNEPDSVVIEYFVTATIKDQKTIPRESIAKVLTSSDDEKAYQALGSFTTPPNIPDTSFYDSLIDKKIPGFIKQYPYTSHITELRAALHTLTLERDRVRKGDRRADGVWISASDMAADPYQMNAKLKFSEMKQSARSNDPVTALKEYELVESAYPAARVTPDAIDLALAQIKVLQGQLSTAEANFAVVDARRQQNIAAALPDQAQQLQNALENDNQSAKAASDKAKQDGTKFFQIFPNSKDELDELQALCASEKDRLTLLQALPMRDSLSATATASQLIAQGQLKGAQDQLTLAAKLWPANAELSSLKKKLDDATKAAAATHTP